MIRVVVEIEDDAVAALAAAFAELEGDDRDELLRRVRELLEREERG